MAEIMAEAASFRYGNVSCLLKFIMDNEAKKFLSYFSPLYDENFQLIIQFFKTILKGRGIYLLNNVEENVNECTMLLNKKIFNLYSVVQQH